MTSGLSTALIDVPQPLSTASHKFVQRSLDHQATHDTGVEYLRRKHRQHLPDAMLSVNEPVEAGL